MLRVEENQTLVVVIPATSKAFVFNVKAIMNPDYEFLDYGPLPLLQGLTLSLYTGGSTTVTTTGVMPAQSYTPLSTPLTFPAPPQIASAVYDNTDMWFISKDHPDRLYIINMVVDPGWLRISVSIPPGVNQFAYQRANLNVAYNFGWRRGSFSIVQFPNLHYGWLFGNDTNVPVLTHVRFHYQDLVVRIPDDPEYIFRVLTRQVTRDVVWVTMPIVNMVAEITNSLNAVYGFDGFPIMPTYKEQEAVATYRQLLNQVTKSLLG